MQMHGAGAIAVHIADDITSRLIQELAHRAIGLQGVADAPNRICHEVHAACHGKGVVQEEGIGVSYAGKTLNLAVWYGVARIVSLNASGKALESTQY